MENTNFCQSCGMPMTETDYGTNKDGTKNNEFCSYCFQNGEYAGEMTMDEMIEACVPHVTEFNPQMTAESAREMMQKFFPSLKRWKA